MSQRWNMDTLPVHIYKSKALTPANQNGINREPWFNLMWSCHIPPWNIPVCGDILAMARSVVCDETRRVLVFRTTHTGKDRIVYNARRVYGKVRWPSITAKWQQILMPVHNNWTMMKTSLRCIITPPPLSPSSLMASSRKLLPQRWPVNWANRFPFQHRLSMPLQHLAIIHRHELQFIPVYRPMSIYKHHPCHLSIEQQCQIHFTTYHVDCPRLAKEFGVWPCWNWVPCCMIKMLWRRRPKTSLLFTKKWGHRRIWNFMIQPPCCTVAWLRSDYIQPPIIPTIIPQQVVIHSWHDGKDWWLFNLQINNTFAYSFASQGTFWFENSLPSLLQSSEWLASLTCRCDTGASAG